MKNLLISLCTLPYCLYLFIKNVMLAELLSEGASDIPVLLFMILPIAASILLAYTGTAVRRRGGLIFGTLLLISGFFDAVSLAVIFTGRTLEGTGFLNTLMSNAPFTAITYLALSTATPIAGMLLSKKKYLHTKT